MYSGGFYSFPSQEEFWAYWSRYIFINRYQNAPKSVHEVLLELVRDKDYFVITTNVDHCFQKAGFDKRHLFYTQGDYGLFQCSEQTALNQWLSVDAVQCDSPTITSLQSQVGSEDTALINFGIHVSSRLFADESNVEITTLNDTILFKPQNHAGSPRTDD